MIENIRLRIRPEEASEDNTLRRIAAKTLNITSAEINDYKITKKSVDARRKPIFLNINLRVAYGDDKIVAPLLKPINLKKLDENAPEVIIVGAGPAGLFAALKAIQHGIRPIILERGKDVDSRRADLTSLYRKGMINPDSNYCFGEGGAGAFSDGKLFTRSKKRGNVEEILQILHQHGAKEDILIDSHAHIGSDRLPNIIKAIRNTIEECGGKVLFDTCVTDISVEKIPEAQSNKSALKVTGVVDRNGVHYRGPVLLCTGHSARDIYKILQRKEIRLESKGFAVGVRLEHPQRLIDRIQYHSDEGRGKHLPAAEYNFVTQADNRGVYSFCMCPGGVIVPAVSASGQLVVNGMSASARASRWANSGMVVEIHPGDFPEYDKFGELGLMYLQENLESEFSKETHGTLNAPAQRMKDFIEGKPSDTLPETSYIPGIHPARIDQLLPDFISKRLQKGFVNFGKKSKGFLTNDAVVIGLESRTSSPVRIPRDKDTLEHPEVMDLYPCGEGAGFAGGIVSAALDGQRCIDALAKKLNLNK